MVGNPADTPMTSSPFLIALFPNLEEVKVEKTEEKKEEERPKAEDFDWSTVLEEASDEGLNKDEESQYSSTMPEIEEKQVLDRFDSLMNACAERTSTVVNNEQALIACQEVATQDRDSSLCDVGQKIGEQMLIDNYCTELNLTKTGTIFRE